MGADPPSSSEEGGGRKDKGAAREYSAVASTLPHLLQTALWTLLLASDSPAHSQSRHHHSRLSSLSDNPRTRQVKPRRSSLTSERQIRHARASDNDDSATPPIRRFLASFQRMYSHSTNGMSPYTAQVDKFASHHHYSGFGYPFQPAQPHQPMPPSQPSSFGYYFDDSDYSDTYYAVVPREPTPEQLSLYDCGKVPTGKVHITEGNQAVEFFSTAHIPKHIETRQF